MKQILKLLMIFTIIFTTLSCGENCKEEIEEEILIYKYKEGEIVCVNNISCVIYYVYTSKKMYYVKVLQCDGKYCRFDILESEITKCDE